MNKGTLEQVENITLSRVLDVVETTITSCPKYYNDLKEETLTTLFLENGKYGYLYKGFDKFGNDVTTAGVSTELMVVTCESFNYEDIPLNEDLLELLETINN